MLAFEGRKRVRFCDGMTRRDFLRAGALSAGAVSLSLTDFVRGAAANSVKDMNCILLFLVGGPSHLDTWDLKPDAPDTIRGPFKPISTYVPGIQICEHFPRMAAMADRYAMVRSVYHQTSPIHETGHQLMQTGRQFRGGREYPHIGAVLSHLRGPKEPGTPPFVVLPGPMGNTGVSVSHGQVAGHLGAKHEPFTLPSHVAEDVFTLRDDRAPAGVDPARLSSPNALLDAVDGAQCAFEQEEVVDNPARREALGLLFSSKAKGAFALHAEPERLRQRYGSNTFGQSCLLARRLVEHGVRLVTVNMFDTVFNEVTWDCHADGGSLAVTLEDYRQMLCPMFDLAYTTLLDDLHQRGMLESTLVVAMGEFGRTPRLNPRGGRDHWPGVWSILFAGGPVRGGQVIGASDSHGMEPKDRPVHAAAVAATIYQALGIDPRTRLVGPRPEPLVDAEAVWELLG